MSWELPNLNNNEQLSSSKGIRKETEFQTYRANELLTLAENNWIDTSSARSEYNSVQQNTISSLKDILYPREEFKLNNFFNESVNFQDFQNFFENHIKNWDTFTDYITDTNNTNALSFYLNNLDKIWDLLWICPSPHFVNKIKEKYLSSKKEQILTLAIGIYWSEEVWNSLINRIEEYETNRWSNFCNLTLREVILKFDQENWNKLSREDIQKLIDWTLETQKVEVEVEAFELQEAIMEQSPTTNSFAIVETLNDNETRVYLSDQWINEELVEQYIGNRNKQRTLNKLIENNNIIKSLSSEEYEEMTSKILAWEDWHKVMSDIKEKYYREKGVEASNILLEEWNVSQIIENNNWTYYFETINGEIINDLTKNELINLWENPEALNNLINTKNKLEELNLWFIWENRESFFKAMNIVKWWAEINNLDSDNINSWELLNILNFTLTILWEQSDFNDITKASSKLRELWNSWLDNWKTDELWRSPIENMFIEKWYIDPNSSLSKFKVSEIINWINNS